MVIISTILLLIFCAIITPLVPFLVFFYLVGYILKWFLRKLTKTRAKTGEISTALITGGSHGIGFEIARLFAQDGYNVVIVAKDENRLADAKRVLEEQGVDVLTITKDLSSPTAAEEIVDELNRKNVQIDYLVNNAGFGPYGEFIKNDPEHLRTSIYMNVLNYTMLCRLLAPGMVERRRGKILNVGSIAGYLPAGPKMSEYFGSKAYINNFTQGLRHELKKKGVSVTLLAPGATRTEFPKVVGNEKSLLYRLCSLTPQKVAKEGYRGMHRGERVVTPGLLNWLIANVVAPFTPKFLLLPFTKMAITQL